LIPSAERVRFVSSGTEADMLALRIARAYTGKNKVIKFEGHFHGWSDGLHASVMTSAGPMYPVGVPQTVLDNTIALPPNDIDKVERALAADQDIAAVILEPTGASMGKVPVFPSFLRDLREVTQRFGAILIFDEVVTGFRVSPGGAQARFGVRPDLTALAKILAGGLPGGAVAGKAELLHMLEADDDGGAPRIGHPGTFNANPLSAAAGVAGLSLVAKGEENRRADEAGHRLRHGMNDVLTRNDIPGCVSGSSSLLHLRLGRACFQECGDRAMCLHPDFQSSPHLQQMAKLALLNAGLDALGMTFIVSSVHTEADVEESIARFEEAVVSLRRDELV
jgi:glutamate-1-semialdehyde 2,1-aminomutase